MCALSIFMEGGSYNAEETMSSANGRDWDDEPANSWWDMLCSGAGSEFLCAVLLPDSRSTDVGVCLRGGAEK